MICSGLVHDKSLFLTNCIYSDLHSMEFCFISSLNAQVFILYCVLLYFVKFNKNFHVGSKISIYFIQIFYYS